MEQLQYQLKSIRLSAMADALPVRAQEASANELPHLEFLALLVQDELDKRKERLLSRRLKGARFPEFKTLDQFDFSFNPALNKRQLLELASGAFIHQARSVLFVGPPGVGKTHLAIALGIAAIHTGYTVFYRSVFDLVEDMAEAQLLGERHQLIRKLLKPDLLIIDEFGMKKLSAGAAEDLLEIFHRRYHHGANIVATNRPIEDWGKILSDNAAASAILDRLLEDAHLITIPGRSYRLKEVVKEQKENKKVDKVEKESLK